MVIIRLQGGLGNQMFQYAFGLSVAFQHQTNCQLDLRYLLNRTPRKNFTFRDFDLSIFSFEVPFYKQDEVIGSMSVYADKVLQKLYLIRQHFKPNNNHIFVEPYFHFTNSAFEQNRNCYYIGYFQSAKYFQTIETILKKQFVIKPNLLSIGNHPMLYSIQNSTSVAVHIRRGDFVNHPVHGNMGLKYFQNAMKIILEKFSDAQFYIFSDDIGWCEANFQVEKNIHFAGKVDAGYKSVNHFELMKQCKHFIISNSSFSWWAAYLSENSNKMVIAPKQWFKDASLNSNDITPTEWIRI